MTDNIPVDEVLGEAEVFTEAEGPDGPWYYKQLSIRRDWNTIKVYGIDRAIIRTMPVEQIDGEDDLLQRLESVNDEVTQEL